MSKEQLRSELDDLLRTWFVRRETSLFESFKAIVGEGPDKPQPFDIVNLLFNDGSNDDYFDKLVKALTTRNPLNACKKIFKKMIRNMDVSKSDGEPSRQ